MKTPAFDAAVLPPPPGPAAEATLERLRGESPWSDHAPHLVGIVASAGDGPLRGAEAGVGWGHGASAILAFLPRVVLHAMVDTWWPVWDGHRYRESGDRGGRVDFPLAEAMRRGALAATDFAGDRRRVHRMASAEAALLYRGRGLDYVYVDGDHSEEGAWLDLAAWWPALRPGGLLIGHDWGRFGVEAAARRFFGPDAAGVALHPESLWSIRKPEIRD